jgi:hypothetical protein
MTVDTKNTAGKNLSYQTTEGKTVPVVALIGGNAHLDPDGARVRISGPVTPFGDVAVESKRVYAQLKFSAGILAQKMTTTVRGSGTVTAANALVTVASGTTANSIARIESTRIIRYAPGQGIETKFTFLFPLGSMAGAKQIIGVGGPGNALAIGYNGTDLSILRRTGGQVEIRTLTVTGAPTADEDLTITLNSGDGVTVAILDADTIGEVARKIANADYSAEGGAWRAVYAGNRVVFLGIRTDTRGGTYTFGAGTTGATGSIAQTTAAVAATDTWVAQSDWNRDKADGTQVLPVIDTALGNVCRISYQWLGFGGIVFELEDPATGEFVRIHEIRFANTSATPSIEHPDMPLMIEVDNGSDTTDCQVQSSSMAAFAFGELLATGPRHAVTNSANIGTVQTPIIAVRLKMTEFDGHTNTIRGLLENGSLGNGGTKPATFQFIMNPTLTGAPTWADVATDSRLEVSTDATSFSGGVTIQVAQVGATGGAFVGQPGRVSEFIIGPGDILLVTGAVSGGSASDLLASLAIVEDV